MTTALTEVRELYLTFLLAGDEYGILVSQAREIVELETMTRVPHAPPFIRGVINLRSTVVPIVDLGAKFGQPPRPLGRRSCAVIVEVAGPDGPSQLGMLADSVSQLSDLAASEIEPAPSFGTPVRPEYLRGLGYAGKGFLLLLDINRLLSPEEMSQVRQLDPAPTS